MADFDSEYVVDDQEPDFIDLTDEDGNTATFVVIGCVAHEGRYYVLSLSVDEENEPEGEDVVYVFVVCHDGEDEYLEYVSDEDTLTAVYERYDAMYREIEAGYRDDPDGED